MQLQFKFNRSLKRELLPGDRRLWLLRSVALRIEQQANPLWRFEIYHRRLWIALAVLAFVGWLSAVSGLYFWLNRHPHNQVGWVDLAAPWRWPGLRAKRGDTAILTALDELKEHDYTTAFYNLRVGLARSPGNVEGRLVLAQLMAAYEPARAVALAEEGLTYAADNPRMIGGLLGIYGSFQIQSHGLETIEGLLAARRPEPLSPASRFMLERARVGFLIQLGRYPEAEKALAALTPPTPADHAGLLPLQIDLMLRTGRIEEAKKLSDQNLAASGGDAVTWRQAVEVAIAGGDADGLQGALRWLKAQAPEAPGAYLLAFQAWHRMKRLSYRDAAEQEYFDLFARNDGALQAIAALAVNLDLPDLVTRATRAAAAARLSTFAFRVHQTELALRRGEMEAATRYLREWENNIDTLQAQQRFYPEFIKRLVRAAFAGTPDQVAFLVAHLNASRGQAQLPAYQLAVTVLEKSGNTAGAAEVTQAGLRIYPQSEPLLQAQQRLTTTGAVAAVDGTPATAEQAPAGTLLPLPTTAREASKQLDELLQNDSLSAARDFVRAIRTRKPSWLPEMEAGLAAREVELAYLSLDQLASRAAARAYLDRYRTEAEQLHLVTVVQRLAAHPRPADARLLADEITASTAATVRTQQALRDLNLADDMAASVASQAAALAILDRCILSRQWAEGEHLLKRLKEKPPEWLASGISEIKVREVQVRLGLDQRPLAFAAVKELVIKGGAARSMAFKLVRDWLGRGEGESARLVAREIARLLPDDPAALRLLKEAEAPRPATP